MFFGPFAVIPFQSAIVNITRDDSGKPIKRDVTKLSGGFHVVSSVTDSFDSLYDAITHPAVFREESKAIAFMEKLKRSRLTINLNNWRIGNHPRAAHQRAPEENPAFYGVI